MPKSVLPLILMIFVCPACSKAELKPAPNISMDEMGGDSEDSDIFETKKDEAPVYIDPLTGLSVEEGVVNSRPVAVVINNHTKARPQSGIGQAAICYEVLAEGNITRLIAIFHDFDVQKIGPVRSARHYFLDFAMDYDAIFVHHGGSPQGYDAIEESGIADLDGMRLAGTFWRDPERVKIPGMYEHSSYTGEALIRVAQEEFGFRPVIREGLEPGFLFYDEPVTPATAEEAVLISVPFANAYGTEFTYEGGLYYRSIEGVPQIDAETGERIAAANVIIQYAPIEIISGDEAGRRDVGVIGEGGGFFVSNGGSVPIVWIKKSHESPTRWLNVDGSELSFNKGKTWICVVSADTEVSIEGLAEKSE